jgi:hypothetical protein
MELQVRIEQLDRLSTTKGIRVMLICEVLEGQTETEKLKANERYNISMHKVEEVK